jgi:VIT1/CCC1 family predicted Fe2+/Mn2+ transporter
MRARVDDLHLLWAEHAEHRISERLDSGRAHSYLRDAILGGIDGCVTTFAVEAGAVGAQFSPVVVVILGFANLLADGFSMAASNYMGAKSEKEQVEEARREEHRHIDEVPGGEREEVRQLFARKGFSGDTLDRIVDVITADRKLWVDTMVREELGLQLERPAPLRSGLATLIAFILVGFVPLIPFLFPLVAAEHRFFASAAATAVAFFLVGTLKGRALGRGHIVSGLETLAIGGSAALLAYLVGAFLRRVVGPV